MEPMDGRSHGLQLCFFFENGFCQNHYPCPPCSYASVSPSGCTLPKGFSAARFDNIDSETDTISHY
jgi:hypothetical protein